jgi:hypothetical protein
MELKEWILGCHKNRAPEKLEIAKNIRTSFELYWYELCLSCFGAVRLAGSSREVPECHSKKLSLCSDVRHSICAFPSTMKEQVVTDSGAHLSLQVALLDYFGNVQGGF